MNIELTKEDQLEAQKISQEIDSVSSNIRSNEQSADSGWVKLGSLVSTVRQKKYWHSYGHRSFGSYVATLEPKIKRKRSQIYLCVGVVEALETQIPVSKLEKMGISKAYELKKYATESGKIVPDSLIEAALDPETDLTELKANVADALHRQPDEKGNWWDFGGFYVTADEKEQIEEVIELVKSVDPAIPHNIPEHIGRKEVFMRLIMEFQSTYAGQDSA